MPARDTRSQLRPADSRPGETVVVGKDPVLPGTGGDLVRAYPLRTFLQTTMALAFPVC